MKEEFKKFICKWCAIDHGFPVKRPADSGVKSWKCAKCGHYNIGSYMRCIEIPYARIKPVGY